MIKKGDRFRFTNDRIHKFRNNPEYGVKKGQIYTSLGLYNENFYQSVKMQYPGGQVGGTQESGCILVKKPIIIIKR